MVGSGNALEGAACSVLDGSRWFSGGGGRELGIAVTDDVVDHVTGLGVPIQVTPSQVAVVFEGGTSHAGHHQEQYMNYVEGTDEASVGAFFESIDEAGYTANGVSRAADVSVPG